jgi:hypothetical protein
VCDPPTFTIFEGNPIFAFRAVTEKEVYDIIMDSPTKSCILDPIPTSLLKQCLAELLPVITAIINISLEHGVFPDQFKHAVVSPLIKKEGLDPNELKNYRPVSNLSFVSKILEKVVLQQLLMHLSDNKLQETHQSAYRKGHSVETAVLSVFQDLLSKMDQSLLSFTAFLDLSAAFDTLDHSILIQRLHTTFGIRGTVLKWLKSYVENRTQCVVIDGKLSKQNSLMYGVPQGSVLGPILFSLYAQPLSKVIERHHCQYHKYADDTELSKSEPPADFAQLEADVQCCIRDVMSWMNSNKLKLNPDKTEVLIVGYAPELKSVESTSTNIGDCNVALKDVVKYLGVQIDKNLSLEHQVGAITRACYNEIRKIASIRQYLTRHAAATLMSALVISRLDYCNSVLAGIPQHQIDRLQRVQNNAARIVLRKRMRDHATPLLQELHWLPVKLRCQFKIATLAFRHFEGTLPKYLSDNLVTRKPARELRSCAVRRLHPPVKPKRSVICTRCSHCVELASGRHQSPTLLACV